MLVRLLHTRVGELVSAHVIPRPDDQIDILLFDQEITSKEKKISEKPVPVVIANTVVKTEVPEKIKEIKVKPKEPIITPKKKVIPKPKVELKAAPVSKSANVKLPSMDQLVVLNVHGLRRIARGVDNFPIKGRDISKANRAKLLDYFKELQ